MKPKSKKIQLRYGENPNQDAYLVKNIKKSIFDYQISGKQISYNNIIDLDSGLKCLNEFNEPTSIIINIPIHVVLPLQKIYLMHLKNHLKVTKKVLLEELYF